MPKYQVYRRLPPQSRCDLYPIGAPRTQQEITDLYGVSLSVDAVELMADGFILSFHDLPGKPFFLREVS